MSSSNRPAANAERILPDSLPICAKNAPADWTTFNTKSMLGETLLGQPKYADAELVLQGDEGMKHREAKISGNSRLRRNEAVERPVQLYEAWGKKDEAAKWRQELEAANAQKGVDEAVITPFHEMRNTRQVSS